MSSKAYFDRHLDQYQHYISDTDHYQDHLSNTDQYRYHLSDTEQYHHHLLNIDAGWYPGFECYSECPQSGSREATVRAVAMKHAHPDALVPGKRPSSDSGVHHVLQQTTDMGAHAPVFEVDKSEGLRFAHLCELPAGTEHVASLNVEGSGRVSEWDKSHTTSFTRTETKCRRSILEGFSYLGPWITASSSLCAARQVVTEDDDLAYFGGYIITDDAQSSSGVVGSLSRVSIAPLLPEHFTPPPSTTSIVSTAPSPSHFTPSPSTPNVSSTTTPIPPALPPKPLAYQFQHQHQYRCPPPSSSTQAVVSTAPTLPPPPPPKPLAYQYGAGGWVCAMDYEACLEDTYGGWGGDGGYEGAMAGRGWCEDEDEDEDGVLRVWSAEVPGWTF